MTTADQQGPPEHVAAVQSAEVSKPRPAWARRWLLVIPAAAIVGLIFGLATGTVAPGLGSTPNRGVSARPTVVFASPATASSVGPSPVASAQPRLDEGEYTVEPGDTLRTIAAHVYGDPDRWSQIYDANRESIGPDPDSLRVGLRLQLPPR